MYRIGHDRHRREFSQRMFRSVFLFVASRSDQSQTLTVQCVVIILPTIGEDLGIPESRLQWVVSAYSLTFGCFLLLWGRIADIFGKRLIFILGSAFVAATLIANPFLKNEIAFNLFRGLQGIVRILMHRTRVEQNTNVCRAVLRTCQQRLVYLV